MVRATPFVLSIQVLVRDMHADVLLTVVLFSRILSIYASGGGRVQTNLSPNRKATTGCTRARSCMASGGRHVGGGMRAQQECVERAVYPDRTLNPETTGQFAIMHGVS